ncbi:hypothetical protein V8F20_003962 [Naviculisporaceae sp. PSN 640]
MENTNPNLPAIPEVDKPANMNMEACDTSPAVRNIPAANASADMIMADAANSQSVVDAIAVNEPEPTDVKMEDTRAPQAVGGLAANEEAPVLDQKGSHTPRLQSTQEQYAEVNSLDLGSPRAESNSSLSTLSPPPPFGGRSPCSSPGPTTGPLAQTENQQEAENEDNAVSQNEEQSTAEPASSSTRASARNTTLEARAKGDKITNGGTTHPDGKCVNCAKRGHACIVNPAVCKGNTCARCASLKEKCSHQQKEEGHFIRANGRTLPQPCTNCAKKAQQGLAVTCKQAGMVWAKKMGTACCECLIDGTPNCCSVNEKPKKKKNRASKKQATSG